VIGVPSALSVPPTNDNFLNAWEVAGESASVNAGNAEATAEVGEPKHAGVEGGASVWFAWTAPRDGIALLQTCQNNFDTLLAVYTGTAVDLITDVASNNDGCASGGGSAVEFSANRGVVYRIAVDGVGGAGDRFWLELRMRPVNDNFADAGELGLNPLHNELATRELGEPNHRGSPGSGSLWYRWTAPYDLTMEFRLCTVSFAAVIEIYTGSTLASLVPVQAQEIGCGAGRLLRVDVVGGTTYRFAVDGAAADARGSGELQWMQASVPPENLEPPSIAGTPQQGEVLSGNRGRWRWARGYFLYWERCSNGGCTIVADNRSTYVVQQGDEGSSIRLRVVAWAGSHQTTAISNSLGPVVGSIPPVTPQPPPARSRQCRVPGVTGMRLTNARRRILRAGCRLGTVRRIHSPRRAGFVIRQTPRAGTRLRAGGRVNVRVSKGRRR
jgi:hypothetical protein